jgi:hypothetical protein
MCVSPVFVLSCDGLIPCPRDDDEEEEEKTVNIFQHE